MPPAARCLASKTPEPTSTALISSRYRPTTVRFSLPTPASSRNRKSSHNVSNAIRKYFGCETGDLMLQPGSEAIFVKHSSRYSPHKFPFAQKQTTSSPQKGYTKRHCRDHRQKRGYENCGERIGTTKSGRSQRCMTSFRCSRKEETLCCPRGSPSIDWYFFAY